MNKDTQTGHGDAINSTSDINSELQAVNQKITELAREREKLVVKRDSLSQELSLRGDRAQQRAIQQASTLLPVSEKVALFKNLFKGRQDIFSHRWQNSKGRSGYSVACNNEWVKGVCNKPRIKCNECPNREYKAVSDQVIYDHLAGKQVVGLYPLLSDNSWYLLAADFDKDDWQDAVKAMAQVCLNFNIPHAIEISRSGNGAHLWIFFSESVPARDARLLGFGLLDKAMETYPSLSFESYDRLFPNQDIMPDGGFGNLIALPLQHQARQKGHCQFVDENLQSYSDQWLFLSQIKTLSSKQLNDLLAQLKPKSQQAIEIRMPWEQGAVVKLEKIDNCPEQVTLTLANHIYIQLDDIPAPLAARLRRLASFSNPVFFKTQAMRFSTHGIPRYITCARIEHGPESQIWLSLPRGCFDDVVALLVEQGITAVIDDKRVLGTKLRSLKLIGKLRKDQSKAVSAIFKHDTGILHAPTAFGKTVTAIGVISKRKVNTLILTHSRQLLDQWQERLRFFLNDIDIGIIGGGKKKPTGLIDVATYQSLINKKENTIDPLVQNYGQIIVDECHHISAPRFEIVLNEVRAKYVLGLTATPDR